MSKKIAGEFEFMRSLPFGPYLPVDSPLHRLDPRTRILLVIIFLTVLILTQQPLGLFIGLVSSLLAWKLANLSYTPFWRGWRAALPFLVFLALLQVVLRTGENGETVLLNFSWLKITDTDIWYGVALLMRFTGFMAVIGLGTAYLSESQLTRGLEALLAPFRFIKLPTQDFVMVIQVTLRYFPLLSQTAERIAKAQASRGADWQPAGWNIFHRVLQIIPVIIPLFVASLRRAETMALAMDARGYGVLPVRTSMIQLHFRMQDVIALCLTAILAVAVVLV